MNLFLLYTTKFAQNLKKFFESDYYLLTVTALTFLIWTFNLFFLGLLLMFLLISLSLITQKHTIYIFPILLIAFFMFNLPFKMSLPWIIPTFAILFLAIVYHFIAFKKTVSFNKLFYPMLAVFIAMLLGGIIYTTKQDGFFAYFKNIPLLLLFAALFLGLYLVFSKDVLPENFDYKLYISKTFLGLALLIIMEMGVYFIRCDDIKFAISDKLMHLGWGLTNNIATVLLSTIPFTFYLSTRYKYGGLLLIAVIIECLGILITTSRGCLLVAALIVPFLYIYTFIKQNRTNRKISLIVLGVSLITAAGGLIIFWPQIYSMFQRMLNLGLSDNGRLRLYKEGLRVFKENFLFGVGFYYKNGVTYDYLAGGNYTVMYMFHNILLQSAASMGVIGLISFITFYAKEYIMLSKNLSSKFGVCVLLSIMGFDLYGMIDVGVFIVYHAITILLLLILTEQILKKRENAKSQEKELSQSSPTNNE